jgi:hypothetical protein
MENPSQSGKPQSGGTPQAVAVEMLNQVYDNLDEKDLSRNEFVNEALDIIGKTKAKPKSKILLPGEDF